MRSTLVHVCRQAIATRDAVLTASRGLACASLAVSLLASPVVAQAQWIADGDALRLVYGPSTWHRKQSDEHVDYNHLVGVELVTRRWTYWGADRALVGFALFDNSFGQFSQYAYFGQEWDVRPLGPGELYFNVTAGALHGYKAPHDRKIPLNGTGVAPAIIPTLGWRVGGLRVGVSMLGLNGLIGTVGWQFDLK